MAFLADDIFALQDLAGWVRRHGIHQVRAAIKHCLKEVEHAPDNVALAELMEHALVVVVEPDAPADDSGSDGEQGDGGPEQLTPPPAPEKPASTPSAKKRATYPKGHEKAGEFIPDDPSTPENEAFTEKGS